MLKKPCVRSLEFSFSQLLFPFTDFYESFDFFSLFCETGTVSYVFFKYFRAKLARPARTDPLAHDRRSSNKFEQDAAYMGTSYTVELKNDFSIAQLVDYSVFTENRN